MYVSVRLSEFVSLPHSDFLPLSLSLSLSLSTSLCLSMCMYLRVRAWVFLIVLPDLFVVLII